PHDNLAADALKTVFAHDAGPAIAVPFDAEEIVAGRIIERAALRGTGGGDADHRYFVIETRNMMDRGAMRVAVQDHFGPAIGDDLAEEAVPLETERGVLQLGVRRMVDEHHAEIAGIAQELQHAV